MKALVTGAFGFVGGHLVDHLHSSGDSVVGVWIKDKPISPKCEVIEADIRDQDSCRALLSKYKPDVIYHLAGMAFVPDAESNFEEALRTNVFGTSNVIRSAHILELPCTIVFVSSAEVYGKISPSELPITEETPCRPTNNYSLSKLMAEEVVKRYDRAGVVKCVIMRPFNHIGPGQSDKFVASSFAHQLARIAKGEAPPVVEVGNLEAKRDFTDVRDVVRAYRLAAQKGRGTYNLSSGKAVSIKEILDTLIQVSEVRVTVKTDPSRLRGPEVPELFGSYEKAQRELGWKPANSLKDTLRDVFVDWRRR